MSSKSSNKEQDFRGIGWVKDAHGLRGELYIQLYAKTADWLSSATTLRLEAAGSFKEFSIERAKPFKVGLIVKLQGLDDRTQAEKWKKAKVHIHATLLVAGPGEQLYLDQLMDYVLVDCGSPVGKVIGFATNGAQDLLRVKKQDGGEALVPLIEDYIEEIDFEKREIHMILPPGLLDIEDL